MADASGRMDFDDFNDVVYTLVNDHLVSIGFEPKIAGEVADSAAFHAENRLREIRIREEIQRNITKRMEVENAFHDEE